MNEVAWIVGLMPVGSDDIEVRAVEETEAAAELAARGCLLALPVYYRAHTREPRAGDRLGTWVDGSTRYAMAPRD